VSFTDPLVASDGTMTFRATAEHSIAALNCGIHW
jgi:hypothetical protein